MTDFCPDLSVDPAVLLTLDAHDRFTDLTTRTYDLATNNLSRFSDINLYPLSFNVNFDFDGSLSPFVRPTRPTIDRSQFEFRAPGEPGAAPVFDPQSVQVDAPPEFTDPTPNLTFAPRPTRPTITAPTAPPRPVMPAMPDEPDFAGYIPDKVILQTLNLPTLQAIQLPEFEADKPVFIEPPFNGNWTFEPQAYVGAMLDDLKAKLRPMIQGQSALPLAVQQAIFNRGRSRAETEGQRALDQIYDEFASRGFSEPNGLLAARVADQRQATQNAIGEVNRDLTIKDFEESLANLRFAITQGIALEGVLIQLHTEEQRFALQAAQFQRESEIALLNARVAVFNARMQGYEVEARVFQIRIQGELAKLEEYRARIEAERLRGEINEQSVRVYAEQWRAVQILADFYRSRVEAVRAEVEINKAPIEIYREEVNAFGERWRAYAAEVDGYKAGNDAEGKKADVFESLARIYGTRMQGYSSLQDVRFRGEDLRIRQHGQRLEVWNAGNRRFEALLASERARLAAVAADAETMARLYTADADVAQAQSAANDRSFQLGLEEARSRVDAQLKSADMKIQQHLGLLTQLAEIRRAYAQISGQLAASTMSAVSYGASVSSGRSKSSSCSQAFSFQGEVADAGL